jgi:nickel-dependent lactate racemase
MLTGKGSAYASLTESEINDIVTETFARHDLSGKRVVIIIPDGTRTAPVPLMFRLFCAALRGKAAQLDFLIALGTHQPMTEDAINQLVGVTAAERVTTYAGVNIFNHLWNQPDALTQLGEISADEIKQISGGILNEAVPVRVNKLIFDYDQIIICGPVFPHEVAGFSGGNKYFFPGISGAEVINFSHWLGAVVTSYEIIGVKHTPVRRVIDRAASFINKPKLCFAMVVKGYDLAGLYVSTPEEAWEAASDLSAQLHIQWVDKPYQRVLSVMPKLYDDLWTAAKGMYKLEPAVAPGGEVIIYAPHIDEVSYSHGHVIDEVGYHVLDYFLKQWDKFKHYPLGVLAHSVHVAGLGEYDAETGIEKPRIKVKLATGISPERCHQINLEYCDPASIKVEEWQGREAEGILCVPKAGEMLYRVKPRAAAAAD